MRKNIQKSNLKVGSLVLQLNMLKRTKKGHKMQDTWLGSYTMVEITQYGCCKLCCARTGCDLKQKVNSCQLEVI